MQEIGDRRVSVSSLGPGDRRWRKGMFEEWREGKHRTQMNSMQHPDRRVSMILGWRRHCVVMMIVLLSMIMVSGDHCSAADQCSVSTDSDQVLWSTGQ